MGYLIDILIGGVSRIVTGELSAHADPLARWIIERAVRRLASADRDRFREEWLAHLEEVPGAVRKLWHVFGCYLCAAKLAKMRARHSKQIDRQRMDAFAEWLRELATQHYGGTDRDLELPPEERVAFESKLIAKLGEFTEAELEFILQVARKFTCSSVRERGAHGASEAPEGRD